jgi:hypothetical protein
MARQHLQRMMPIWLAVMSACAIVLSMFSPASAADDVAKRTAEHVAFFETKIRPVLVEHCYDCHSEKAQTEGKLKGGLRLDSAAGWTVGGDSGPALVAGKADESPLLAALRYESYEMPPKGKLPDAVIADFEKWIEGGAHAPAAAGTATSPIKKNIDIEAGRQFWAYQPPKLGELPDVKITAAAANRIDRHILAKLDAAGLTQAKEADRVTLARRLCFDLVGLPPSPEEVDAFAADPSPDAYERFVDGLLASPRFGERWARHWLDIARYGESLTLRGFILKDAWRYRDYVIEAFNDDRPYDQFVREQLAGDLMQSSNIAERRKQITATSFLALGNTNLEEQDKKQLDMDVVDEQLDVIGKAILGQTIACARCHDHKFDPIPTRDYYALAGILRGAKMLEHANVSEWMEVPLPLEPEAQRRFDEHSATVATLETKLKESKQQLVKLTPSGRGNARVVAVEKLVGTIVDDTAAKRVGTWQTSTHTKEYIGDGYLHDQDAGKGEKTLTFAPNLPKAGRYEVRVAFVAGDNRAASVPVTVFSADGEKTIHVNQQAPPPIEGHFVSLGQYNFEKTDQSFVLIANDNTRGHVIADAVQFIPVEQLGDAKRVGDSVSRSGDRDTTQRDRDTTGLEGVGPRSPDRGPDAANEQQSLAAAIASLEAELTRLKQTGPQRETAISLVDGNQGVDLPIHIRGSVHTHGDLAPRGFLQVATFGPSPTLPKDASGRLELAAWLGSNDNPLTARVMANRVWHWLFGAGLVRTVDNFGTTGEPPSHPDLLDELAIEFADNDWSVKQLIRRIVASRTYRAASESTEHTKSTDPEDCLLAHANRRRLEAECIRDAMLAASGELRIDATGPTFPTKLSADYAYRHQGHERSIYVPAFRNATSDVLAAFDAADPSLVTGRRDISTVAPQALLMLNHAFVSERAAGAAKKLLTNSEQTTAQRIESAYRTTLGRWPSPAEVEIAKRFLENGKGADEIKWQQIYLALFASVDFRYVD